MSKSANQQLLAKSLAAVRWNYLGIVGRVLMQVVSQIALARLLGPDAFGAVAAGTLIVGFAILIAGMGMNAALVQRPTLNDTDIRAAFTLVLLLTLVLGAAIYTGRFRFAAMFGDATLVSILPVLLVMLAAQTVGALSSALLARRMDFKSIQLSMLIGYFIGFFLIGIGLALLGAGVWALVAAWVSQYVICAALLFSRARFTMLPLFRFAGRDMQRFGVRVVLTNMANWFLENADNLIIGKVFGTVSLGNYAAAYNLARNPTNQMVNSVQGVLFSSVSALQHDRIAVRRGYLLTIAALALVACPMFFGLALSADTVIAALYGAKWQLAGALLVPVALAMPLHALMAVAGPVLWGRGNVGVELAAQVAVGLAFALCLWVTSRISVLAVAWAVFGVYAFRAVLLSFLASRNVAANLRDFSAAICGPLLFGLLIAAILVAIDRVLIGQTVSAIPRLILLVGTGAIAMLVLPLLGGRWIVPSILAHFLAERIDRLPRVTRAWVRATVK